MSRLFALSLVLIALACATNDDDLPPLPDVAAEPAAESGARELPKTASELPRVGLAGLGALAAAWGVRGLRRRLS